MAKSTNGATYLLLGMIGGLAICALLFGVLALHKEYDTSIPKNMQANKIAAKLAKMPFGTVIVTKAGEVYLLNKVEGPTISFNSRRQPGLTSVFDFSKDVADFYEPHNNLEERRYLLEKFAQGEKVAPDWKKSIPKM